MEYGSSRVAERVPAEAMKASRVGRRCTREAVPLVRVGEFHRQLVQGDIHRVTSTAMRQGFRDHIQLHDLG